MRHDLVLGGAKVVRSNFLAPTREKVKVSGQNSTGRKLVGQAPPSTDTEATIIVANGNEGVIYSCKAMPQYFGLETRVVKRKGFTTPNVRGAFMGF